MKQVSKRFYSCTSCISSIVGVEGYCCIWSHTVTHTHTHTHTHVCVRLDCPGGGNFPETSNLLLWHMLEAMKGWLLSVNKEGHLIWRTEYDFICILAWIHSPTRGEGEAGCSPPKAELKKNILQTRWYQRFYVRYAWAWITHQNRLMTSTGE
jgi:hypothetical protein